MKEQPYSNDVKQSTLVSKSVVTSTGRIDEVISEQGTTLDLIDVLEKRLATVTDPAPENAEDVDNWSHINAINGRQRVINSKLRRILDSIVL